MRSDASCRTVRWLAVPALPVALMIGFPAYATAAPAPLAAPRIVAAVVMDGGHEEYSRDIFSLFPSDGDHATHDAGASGHHNQVPTGGSAGHTAGDDHASHNPATTDPHGGHQRVPAVTSSDGHGDSHTDRNTGAGADQGGHGGGHGSTEPPSDRPRALVLGGFGVVNAAVLASAAVLRRRGAADRRSRSRAARQRAAASTR